MRLPINEAGIKIASVTGQEYIMLNNGMIALVDAARNEVKMAMGHFYNAASGTDFIGILADIIGGTLLAGKNLVIECPDINGGIMQFKVDSSGVFLNNSRMYFQSDKGGKIGIDSHWGIFGGTKDLFQVTDTGHVSPSFAGANGTLVLDSDGFPVNANFLLPIDGDPYFRGTVIAKAGKFDGDIYARNLYFWDGSDVKTLLSEATKKIPSGLLDLGNIQLDGISGDISLTGNINIGGNIDFSGAGSITWGSKTPVKYQFSATSITGPWHDTMQTNDKYRRDSLDGGTTWGAGYQFVGKDGTDGTDGKDALGTWENVKKALSSAAAIKESIITIDGVGAPNIYGGKIYGTEIYSGDGEDSFVRMTKSGLEVFVDDVYSPKFTLGLGESADKSPFMVLGSGDGAGSNRFWIGKGERYAMMYYRYSDRTTGFMFNDDGTITVSGELKGVTAEFG